LRIPSAFYRARTRAYGVVADLSCRAGGGAVLPLFLRALVDVVTDVHLPVVPVPGWTLHTQKVELE
jgi:hypothetical protein